MAQKSYEERISELQTKQKQLAEQEKMLKRRQSQEERKQRTRRLIEMGGIVESVLGRTTIDEDKERLLMFLKNQEKNGRYFSKAMNNSIVATANNVKEEL